MHARSNLARPARFARRAITVLATIACAAAWTAPEAHAASLGVLDYGGCISSFPTVEACVPAPTVLSSVSDLELSPDGKHVYVASEHGDAISWLSREPRTGSLTWGGCVSSRTDNACDPVPGGSRYTLDIPLDIAVTADGTSAYVVSAAGDAVAHFERDRGLGTLTYQGCTSSNVSLTECELIPGASEHGTGSALNDASAVVAAADGEHVYVGASEFSPAGNTITTLSRDPATGDLTYESCVSSALQSQNCEPLENAKVGSGEDALSGIHRMLLSADGSSLFVASAIGDAVSVLKVGAEGRTTHGSCATSRPSVVAASGCVLVSTSGPGGALGPLDRVVGLVEGPERETLYATSSGTPSVTRFSHDSESGEITFARCISADSRVQVCERIPHATAYGLDSQFSHAFSPAISADGTWLFLAGGRSSSIVRFQRDPETGALRYADCVSSDITVVACEHTPRATVDGVDTALSYVHSLVLSPDGRHLYAGSLFGNAISGFHRTIPANRIRVIRFRQIARNGISRLRVELPSAGRFTLNGPQAEWAGRSVTKRTRLSLPVRPKLAVRIRLRQRGHARLRVELTFVPKWGVERAIKRSLRLVRR